MDQLDTSGGRKRSNISRIDSNDPDSNSNQSNEQGSQESDDVHSLCSSLSNLPTTRSTVASRKTASSSINTQSTNLQKHPCFRKIYSETGVLPTSPATFSTIRIERSQIVQEYTILGEYTTFKKQSARGSNNPWRRYGPLVKLHEIGGYAPSGKDKKDRKNRDQLTEIKKNSKPPPRPACNQMVLSKVKSTGKGEGRLELHIPKNLDVDATCQVLAAQVKTYVLASGHCLMKDE